MHLGRLRLRVGLQGGNLRGDGALFARELVQLALVVLLAQFDNGTLPGFLRHACGAGEHPVVAQIDIHQVDASVAQDELAHLVGVGHAARFEHVERAVALAVELDVAQQQPGIHQR